MKSIIVVFILLFNLNRAATAQEEEEYLLKKIPLIRVEDSTLEEATKAIITAARTQGIHEKEFKRVVVNVGAHQKELKLTVNWTDIPLGVALEKLAELHSATMYENNGTIVLHNVYQPAVTLIKLDPEFLKLLQLPKKPTANQVRLALQKKQIIFREKAKTVISDDGAYALVELDFREKRLLHTLLKLAEKNLILQPNLKLNKKHTK